MNKKQLLKKITALIINSHGRWNKKENKYVYSQFSYIKVCYYSATPTLFDYYFNGINTDKIKIIDLDIETITNYYNNIKEMERISNV